MVEWGKGQSPPRGGGKGKRLGAVETSPECCSRPTRDVGQVQQPVLLPITGPLPVAPERLLVGTSDLRCLQLTVQRSNRLKRLTERSQPGMILGALPLGTSGTDDSVHPIECGQDASCFSSSPVSSAALASTGISTFISVNSPSLESTEMLPPCFWMMSLDIARPRPVP